MLVEESDANKKSILSDSIDTATSGAVRQLHAELSDSFEANPLKNNNRTHTMVLPNAYQTDTSISISISKSKDQEDLFNGKGKNVDNFSENQAAALAASGLFDVDKFLSPLDRQRARAIAPLWDMDYLIKKFNTFVRDKEVPKYPGSAFVAWCKKFVKDQAP